MLVAHLLKVFGPAPGQFGHARFVGAAALDHGQPGVGRIAELSPFGQQLARQPDVVVPEQVAEDAVIGVARLEQHLAGAIGAAGASGHLHQELKGVFVGAEVGQQQARVGVDHAHERHARKVEPLGDHLGAEQDVGFAPGEAVEQPVVGAAAARGVEVHAEHAGLRKQRLQRFFDALRADAQRFERRRAALPTGAGVSCSVATVVAA